MANSHDSKLKTEIDEIMKSIDNTMKKIENFFPAKKDVSSREQDMTNGKTSDPPTGKITVDVNH